MKAAENGGTAIGIRCAGGVVLAVEKIITSKLLKAGANKRIATVDRNIGVVTAGLVPDGRHFVSRARDEASSWRKLYKGAIPTAALASRLGGYVQAYTLYSSVRPFGVTAIVGGWDTEGRAGVDGEVGNAAAGGGGKVEGVKRGGPGLYMIEPSGLYWVSHCPPPHARILGRMSLTDPLKQGYYGAATGKGRQTAKSELEKLDLASNTLSLHDGVKEAARIIYVAHEDTKDKEFELEMSWISDLQGPTKGRHLEVPAELREEAEKLAKKSLEGDDDDDEDEEGDGDAGADPNAAEEKMEE